MIEHNAKAVLFRLNGVSHAFLREMGCRACPRCAAVPAHAAHTSVSLLVKSAWAHQRRFERHVLFDCGAGVVDSLVEYGIEQVDYLFNSHNHLDHISDLDRLLNSQRRTQLRRIDPATGAAVAPKPILYATTETWQKGIAWSYPWLTGLLEWHSLNQAVGTGMPIVSEATGLGIGLRVTPIPVYHGPFAFEPVIFVVEFGQGNEYRKLVLCWDFLHLVTQHPTPSGVDPAPAEAYVPLSKPTGPGSWGYPTDDYPAPPAARAALYAGVANPAAHVGPEELLPTHQPLHAPHELFLAGNTITPQPHTGHASLRAGLALVRRLQPQRTWIVHYSGHEDPEGPCSDDELQAWLDRTKGAYGVADRDIVVAKPGLVLTYAVSGATHSR